MNDFAGAVKNKPNQTQFIVSLPALSKVEVSNLPVVSLSNLLQTNHPIFQKIPQKPLIFDFFYLFFSRVVEISAFLCTASTRVCASASVAAVVKIIDSKQKIENCSLIAAKFLLLYIALSLSGAIHLPAPHRHAPFEGKTYTAAIGQFRRLYLKAARHLAAACATLIPFY